MEAMTFLGIDVGTSSVKSAIFDASLRLQSFERAEHSVKRPQEGWAEVSLEDVWETVKGLVRRLAAQSPGAINSVRAAGLSVLGPCLAALAADGRALTTGIIFMDRRSVIEAKEIAALVPPQEFFGISANRLMPGSCSLTSMLWIKRNLPEVYKKTRFFGHLNTFLARRMTGNFGMDPSNASYTGLFETGGNLSWSSDAVRRVGIDSEKLPPIVPSASVVGLLACPELESAGLPPGIPVAMGGGDTACSALAVGAVNQGDVFESAGTTNVITACSEKPVFDDRFMNRCHVVPDRWLYHGAMSSTGAALLWLRDEILKGTSQEGFDTAIEDAARLSPASDIPIFLPYMAGERSPVWDPFAKGVLFGLGLEMRREHLIRAVLEGCAFGTRQLLGILEEVVGTRISDILSIGGGAKIEAWTRIKADVTGRAFTVLDLNDAAVAGAAMLGAMAGGYLDPAAVGAGRKDAVRSARADPDGASPGYVCRVWKRFMPDRSYQASYDRRYAVYKELYPRLCDLFRS
ncbi:MAG TPA: FGGY family carbohydrate kinase [archaeon]|nr:FGGY family carbohydrate kinase [archaeon]